MGERKEGREGGREGRERCHGQMQCKGCSSSANEGVKDFPPQGGESSLGNNVS